MGQVPQEMLQDYASDFLPVSSCPDGWRSWRHVPGAAAGGNKKLLMELLSIGNNSIVGCFLFLYLLRQGGILRPGHSLPREYNVHYVSIESDNFLLNSSWFSIRDYERGRDR